jgi:tetratricopeptide (TPR) repeat protein
MHFLSLCVIVKNEGLYLHEWIRHHLMIGVEHFYVYDNGSKPPAKKILGEFTRRGLATVVDFPGPARQLEAYNHCLGNHGRQSHWLGVIDCDEFLLPKQHEDLRELLLDYDEHAGLAVNCLIFGSSGHIRRPPGLQTQCYRHRFPLEYGENCLVKCLVQPRRTTEAAGVHHFHYPAGNHCVNERREPVFGPFSPVSTDKIQINHYFFRSQQDFCQKLERGHADFPQGVMKYDLEQFYRQSRQADVLDEEIPTRFPLPQAKLGQWEANKFSTYRNYPQTRLVEKIQGALQAKDMKTAMELAKAYVMSDPASHEAWLLLGIGLNQAGMIDQARKALYRSIQLFETIEAFFQVFLIHVQRQDHAEGKRIAAYLYYRLLRTEFTKEAVEYARMVETLAGYLASQDGPLPGGDR